MRSCCCALACLLCLAALSAQEVWSGKIYIREFIEHPEMNDAQRQDLSNYLSVLKERLRHRRAQLEAEEAEILQGLLEEDILSMEAAVRAVQEELGGRRELSEMRFVLDAVPLDSRQYVSSAARLRAEIAGAVIVARWDEGVLRGRDRWQRFEGAVPLSMVEVLPKPQDDPSKAVYEQRLRSQEGELIVEYRRGLPNPWAGIVSNDLDPQSYPVQLARIPGLPLRVQRSLSSGGRWILQVEEIREKDLIEDEVFADP